MNLFPHRGRLLTLALAACIFVEDAAVRIYSAPANRVFAVQNRSSTPNFQLFLNLRSDGTAGYSGPLYSPAGGVYAADFGGSTLYAIELPNGSSDNYLVAIPYEGALIGQGARISANPVGFNNIEGLAVADGTIYATCLNYGGHHSRLITIDPVTGIGTLVGTTGTDIMIVGLAFDPVHRIMYGAGTPFASLPSKLYRINSQDAQAAEVGPLGVPIQSLTWDGTLGLIGAFDKLYQVDSEAGATTQIGSSDFTDGHPGTVNGIYALAAYLPPDAAPFLVRSIAALDDSIVLSWDTSPGGTYQVESRGDLSDGNWTVLSGGILATGTATLYTNAGGANAPSEFYRVKVVSPP